MKTEQKKYLVIGGLIILILVIGYWLLVVKNKNDNQEEKKPFPTEIVIPTVDASVAVELKPIKRGEIKLIVQNAPQGTRSIDFELSYSARNIDMADGENAALQGAIGKCFKLNGSWECGESYSDGRKIVLGTCSSGVCRYHNIVGLVKVLLKFTGDYGEKVFEKEYEI